MNVFVLALFLLIPGSDSAKPEVRGLLATKVTFNDESGAKLAAAILDLLATSTFSRAATEEEWLDAQLRCHVCAKFSKPQRAVEVSGAAKLDVAEVVVTFPLPSTGAIWVRSGDRFAYFAKYSGPALVKIQESLGEAKPAE
jgi:hypothetical protein